MHHDETAAMMMLEVIIFASMIFLALLFLYQLSPASTHSDNYSNELKIWADDALFTVYTTLPPSPMRNYPDYPQHMLIHYIMTNDYNGLTTDLNSMLPSTVMYNIYISTGEQTVFWCNSFGDVTTVLPVIDPVTVSHFVISLDRGHLHFPSEADIYVNDDHCVLADTNYIYDYYGETYDIILELWYK
jgi:hypothetical protein